MRSRSTTLITRMAVLAVAGVISASTAAQEQTNPWGDEVNPAAW